MGLARVLTTNVIILKTNKDILTKISDKNYLLQYQVRKVIFNLKIVN